MPRSKNSVPHQSTYYYGLNAVEFDPTFINRFLSKFQIGVPDQCWNWTGGAGCKGYGSIRLKSRRLLLAHRVSYELFKGKIPEGMVICHTCVNPNHLFAGTQRENTKDAYRKGRLIPPIKHISSIQKDRILSLRTQGVTYRKISEKEGLAVSTILRIAKQGGLVK